MGDHIFYKSSILSQSEKIGDQTTNIPDEEFMIQPGFEPGATNPESAMLTPQLQIVRNCWKN